MLKETKKYMTGKDKIKYTLEGWNESEIKEKSYQLQQNDEKWN